VSALNPGKRCALHRFPARGLGEPTIAFYSHCTGAPNLYFFSLLIENESSRPLPLSLTDLFVVDRGGESHQPVDVTNDANEPAGFLPDSTNIAPHATLSGLVALNDSGGYTPARFQLAAGGAVFTVRFAGEETIVPGGTLRHTVSG